jgi:succinate dehydrogenase / fumarate reductase, membrane anchor subunit
MADYRTALGRARGLGSAKHGVGHFIGQRVSAVALVFLICWGFSQAPALVQGGYDGARAWLAQPLDALLAILLIATGFYHGQLGFRTIIEDYIGRRSTRTILLILNTFVWIVGASLAAICLLKVALGVGAG